MLHGQSAETDNYGYYSLQKSGMHALMFAIYFVKPGFDIYI